MKIAFLAPSLEPGRSGVGDYTQLLAGEIERSGHECFLIGLNDSDAVDWQRSARPQILRLSAAASWKERFGAIQRACEHFNPDWVSLQFVPYGYHRKGLAWSFGRGLPRVLDGYAIHLFFHELWIGCSEAARWRERAIGSVQRALTLRLVDSLRPAVVHTTNALYAAILYQRGVAAGELPLFSAIPVVTTRNPEQALAAAVRAKGIEIDFSARERYLIGGFFGTIHVDWPAEPFFGRMAELSAETGREVLLVSIGRANPEIWNDLVERHGEWLRMVALGEQPADMVSYLLQSLDFGVSTTPANIIGKSIGVAAMLEHGLPVIASWPGAPVRGIATAAPGEPRLITDLTRLTPEAVESSRVSPRSRLPEVAARFCSDLESAGRSPMKRDV